MIIKGRTGSDGSLLCAVVSINDSDRTLAVGLEGRAFLRDRNDFVTLGFRDRKGDDTPGELVDAIDVTALNFNKANFSGRGWLVAFAAIVRFGLSAARQRQ